MNIVEEAILSTDLAMYFDKQKKFAEYVENGEFDWQNDEKKECKLESAFRCYSSSFVAFEHFIVAASRCWDVLS